MRFSSHSIASTDKCVVGSSMKMTSGLASSDDAMATRFLWPALRREKGVFFISSQSQPSLSSISRAFASTPHASASFMSVTESAI